MRAQPSTDLVGTITRIPPSELNTYHRNPRRGDVSAIAASLKAHDQYKPICVKPVSLIAECLNNSCRPGGLVLDTFAGSGSTLIAAHMLHQRAAVIELDPIYADVIITRYEKATSDEAVLESA